MNVLRRPGPVTLGVALQFTLMPLIAWTGIGGAWGCRSELALGMVLVGFMPRRHRIQYHLLPGKRRGCRIHHHDGRVHTAGDIPDAPADLAVYIGQKVPVPVPAMMLNIFTIVLAPVTLGVFINYRFGDRIGGDQTYVSPVTFRCCRHFDHRHHHSQYPVTQLAMLAPAVIAAVCLHNISGLAGGYCLAWLFGCDERIRRTLAIEVGMQNSGLAIALVELTRFPLTAALPGAVFSIWHNISGSVLAAWWGRNSGAGD